MNKTKVNVLIERSNGKVSTVNLVSLAPKVVAMSKLIFLYRNTNVIRIVDTDVRIQYLVNRIGATKSMSISSEEIILLNLRVS